MWLIDDWPSREKGWIKPLDVADLQYAVVLPSRVDQFVGIGSTQGDWFFDQAMHALLQQFERHRMMHFGRRGDDGGIDPASQFGKRSYGSRLIFGSHGIAIGDDWIHDGHEFNLGQGASQPRMNAAEVTRANHCQTNATHAAFLRSRPRPLRPSCWFCTKLNR